MRIVTISGLDGSGKSTQIESLKNFLEKQGKSVFYFHAINFSIATKLVGFKRKYCLICKLTKRCQKKITPKSIIKANAIQIHLRKMAFEIDLFRFILLKNKLTTLGYDYILSDRYFYDTALNINYLAKNDSGIISEKFIPKPDCAIYLDTDPYEIMQRERKPDQGLEYLIDKKKLYDKNRFNLKIINGNRDSETIFSEIKKISDIS